jgi:putative ABC transport system permease protein
MTFTVTLESSAYPTPDAVRARITQFEARLKQIPGVTAAAAATVVPLGTRGSMVDFAVIGAPPPPPNVNAEIGMGSVTPEYFRAIGTPVRYGREFTDRDITGAPLVVMINEAGVRQWFGGENPLGKFVTAAGARREIVGVVGDIRQRGLRDLAGPMLYAPYMQRTSRSPRFIVRSDKEAAAQAGTIRAAFREIDPEVPISAFVPFSQLVADSVARPRFYTSLLVLFAATALVLAAVGIFGVMSYSVAQRSREIGIRLALGAARGQVMTRIVGRAVALAAAGAALGVVGTLALARVIQSLLFEVPVLDPLTLAAVVGVLSASAALASYLPARRAAGIDPVIALREG